MFSQVLTCLSVVTVLAVTLKMQAALYSYPNILWSNLRRDGLGELHASVEKFAQYLN